MDHRVFLSALGLLAAPRGGGAQQSEKIARIAMLRSESRPLDDPMRQNIAALRAGLQDEGLTERRHYRIDYHSPSSETDALRLARALVHDNVDVIHAIAFIAIYAAWKATATIPIVAHGYETDAVAAGLVATLARPGGNITGMFLDHPDIAGKLLDLLKRALSGIRRIGILWDPLTGRAQLNAVERAGKALELEAIVIETRAGHLDPAVQSAADGNAKALLLLGSPVLSSGFTRIAQASTAARLPAIALFPAFARRGGLMAYGPEAHDQYRQEGRMIAKILKGARPADCLLSGRRSSTSSSTSRRPRRSASRSRRRCCCGPTR